MKKFTLIIGLFLISITGSVNAQSVLAHSGDTVTNTETEYLTIKVQNTHDIVTIQYVANKLSGTVGGTATLQGSLDGINYVNALTSQSDSVFTNTNVATQTKIWFVEPGRYLYYRVACTGSGTMAALVYAYLIGR